MASTKEELSSLLMTALTTEGVILSRAAQPGTDYLLLRLITESATISIRDLVQMEADDLTEVDLSGAQAVFVGIVPDTDFNKRQVSENNGNIDWTYDLLFADGAEIDVAFPITALIVSVEIAASQALTFNSPLKADATGHMSLAAAGEDYCGRSLAIVGSGTGTQIIAAVLFGFGLIHD